ncbi:MAG TPA: P-II family nitrogen regulator [Symbiobacteriaceae bacterium]|nr:P-II family nitrogen regulator [Symbiobacteriaceae bacterium]
MVQQSVDDALLPSPATAPLVEVPRRIAAGEVLGQKIEAIIRPERLEAVRNALSAIGVSGVTVSEVRGYGEQRGYTETYRGTTVEIQLRPKVKLEVIVPESRVQAALDTILEYARTGSVGDGKVFVFPIVDAIRVRTGERGASAV